MMSMGIRPRIRMGERRLFHQRMRRIAMGRRQTAVLARSARRKNPALMA
jgi:hypothetical protein